MALTTRTLPAELSPPQAIEQRILTYLSFHRLRAAILVSKAWNAIASDEKIWREALAQDEKAQIRLPRALVEAIKAQKYEHVRRLVSIGAIVNEECKGIVDREFPWFKSAAGFFSNPTILSIAANLGSGQEGIKITCLLLQHDANVLQRSEYSDWVANSADGGPAPPLEFKGHELPSESACDDDIKTLLLLAEVETELLAPNSSTPVILSKLKEASNHRRVFVKEYLDQLMLLPDNEEEKKEEKEEKEEFTGVQKKLKPIHCKKLTDIAEFKEVYQAVSHPTFFEEHWLSLLTAGLGMLYSLCCFKSTVLLGAFFIGLFSSATIPAAFAIILGVLIIGLISGGTCEFLKKMWDYYHPDIHFPVVIDDKPPSKTFSGRLFPNRFTILHENKENKINTSASVPQPLSPTIF